MSKKVVPQNVESTNASPAVGQNSPALEKLLAMWRSRNALAAGRVSTFSLMAAALSACNDSSSSSSSSAEETTAFSLDISGAVATVAGEFVFLTEPDAGAMRAQVAQQGLGLVPASVNLGSESGDLLGVKPIGDVRKIPGDVTSLKLDKQVTVVGDIGLFDLDKGGLAVTGDGNVWVLIGQKGEPGDYTAKVNIKLSGGDLVFDMPSDEDLLTLEDGSVIDLGGGKLIISDGVVHALGLELKGIGGVEVNSTLVLNEEQFADLIDSGVGVEGAGEVRVDVTSDAKAAEIFDLLIENPGLVADTVNLSISDGQTSQSVDIENVVNSKFEFLANGNFQPSCPFYCV